MAMPFDELTEEQTNALFRDLESENFPTDRFEQIIGGLVARWKLVGDTKSVPWQWVMLAELALTSFCASTALLLPEEGIKVYALIWAFYLHMGSTNSSGIITEYADILDALIAHFLEHFNPSIECWCISLPVHHLGGLLCCTDGKRESRQLGLQTDN